MRSILVPAILLAWGWPALSSSVAQDTNLALIESLTVSCLRETPDTTRAFHVVAPDTLPYARAALNASWRSDGRRIMAISTSPRDLPTLRYAIDDVSIVYRRLGRRSYERTVAVAVEYTLLAPDGTILDDGVCRRDVRDSVPASSLAELEDPVYPETVGIRPEGRWLRRYVEPVILTGAFAVGVFLFFSLRSSGGS